MIRSQVARTFEDAVGHGALDLEQLGEVITGQFVFREDEAQGLQPVDAAQRFGVLLFVSRNQVGQQIEIIVLIDVELVSGQLVDDLHGVFVVGLVAQRARHMPGDQRGVGLGEAGDSDRAGISLGRPRYRRLISGGSTA